MSQPPYGVPPQQGQPQGYPPAPQGYPPQAGGAPSYLQGGAPATPAPAGYGAPAGGYGPALPPPPPSQKRTIGFLMGLLTAAGLLGFAFLVLLVSLVN